MEGKSMIIPLSADEIIAGLRKKAKGRRRSKNIEIMVRVLSAKALFPDELVEKLRNNPDYDCRGADDEFIKQRLQTLRHHKILGRLGGWYFIKGTAADPEIQDRVRARKPRLDQPKKKTGKIRSLRSIVYEILQKEPLPLNWLVRQVENHPDYDGRLKGQKLHVTINWVLNEKENKERFFERESKRKKFSVWRVKAGSGPPPRGFHQPPSPQQNELYRIMRAKSVIKGWSYPDLYEEVSQPNSGYRINPGSSPNLATAALRQVLARDKGERFERISAAGEFKGWRAKWLGPIKTPSNPKDFKDLASKVLDDVALPLSLDNLLKIVRQYGHLFGYLVNELPLSFLENSIIRAIAQTRYKNEGRVF